MIIFSYSGIKHKKHKLLYNTQNNNKTNKNKTINTKQYLCEFFMNPRIFATKTNV